MAEKPKHAWWLTLTINPEYSKLDNINVSEFRDDWSKAIYLDDALIKKKVNSAQYAEFKQSQFSHLLNLDLNKNNINETIKVGVFEKKNNKKGIFLAIFENNKLLKVFSDSTNKGFSTLLKYNNTLRWYKCMNCGDYESIKWNGKTFTIE